MLADFWLSIRAGLPTATTPSPTGLTTTAPAPMVVPAPTDAMTTARCANPTIGSNLDLLEFTLFSASDAPRGITAVLPPPAETLNVRSDLGSVANRACSQNAVRADIDALAEMALGCGEEAAELNAAVERAALERQLVVCDPQVIPEDAGCESANMGGEAEASSPAAESRYGR